MGIAQVSKKELFSEIEQLPNSYLVELQDFIRYLKFKQTATPATSGEQDTLPPENDPILRAIGLAEVPPFSDDIDDLLYGAD